jgi:hypothetical protein
VAESFRYLTPEDLKAIVAPVRTVPATSSDLPTTLAPLAPVSHKEGVAVTPHGKRTFEGAYVSCHNWTGVADLSPYAPITGSRTVNDPSGTNVVQVILAGAATPSGIGPGKMPAFGVAYSNQGIADSANCVTTRFGTLGSSLTGNDAAVLRAQSAQ